MVKIIHLNTSLGIMIMMLLGHYGLSFHKWLAILINLTKIKKNKNENKNKIKMSLKFKDKQILKNCNKIWKKKKD